ncbi:hypothetical protein BKA70DRAFT_780538 [Coprinopsis sp. MPI-PUGE-AT-0042]|nr:hypothetical protein BKA70DRAFT_780538 [Coprinopsis sp. MPI-PUGE-AT-0042]
MPEPCSRSALLKVLCSPVWATERNTLLCRPHHPSGVDRRSAVRPKCDYCELLVVTFLITIDEIDCPKLRHVECKLIVQC